MVGFSLQMMIKLESSGGGREKKEEGGVDYVLEPGSPSVWQRETVFPKPIINQGYWAASRPSSRQIK